MKDAVYPVQSAAVSALSSCGYTVTSSPGTNRGYPYIYIQADSAGPLIAKDCHGERVLLQFHCWSRLSNMSEVSGMKGAVMAIIVDSWRPTLTNHRIGRVEYDGSQYIRENVGTEQEIYRCIVTYVIDAWEK